MERYCYALTMDENFILCAMHLWDEEEQTGYDLMRVWQRNSLSLHLNFWINSGQIEAMASDNNELVVKRDNGIGIDLTLFNLETGDQIFEPWDIDSDFHPIASDKIKQQIRIWKMDAFWEEDDYDERRYSQFQLIRLILEQNKI